MNQQERINMLCVEQRELGNLLSGMQACATIPPVFIAMARTKALRIAEELAMLDADSAEPHESMLTKEPEAPAVAPDSTPEVAPVMASTQPSDEVAEPESEEVQSSNSAEVVAPKVDVVEPLKTPEPMSAEMQPSASSERGDIRSLLTMGDKFLFQRELFRGDIGMLNYTLDQLNKFEGMREAEAFIRSEFRWKEDAPGVKEFYELLERYYLNTII